MNSPSRELGDLFYNKQINNKHIIYQRGVFFIAAQCFLGAFLRFPLTLLSYTCFIFFYFQGLSCFSAPLVSRFCWPPETPFQSVQWGLNSSNLERNPHCILMNRGPPCFWPLACPFNVNKSTRLHRFWAKLNLLGWGGEGEKRRGTQQLLKCCFFLQILCVIFWVGGLT